MYKRVNTALINTNHFPKNLSENSIYMNLYELNIDFIWKVRST